MGIPDIIKLDVPLQNSIGYNQLNCIGGTLQCRLKYCRTLGSLSQWKCHCPGNHIIKTARLLAYLRSLQPATLSGHVFRQSSFLISTQPRLGFHSCTRHSICKGTIEPPLAEHCFDVQGGHQLVMCALTVKFQIA